MLKIKLIVSFLLALILLPFSLYGDTEVAGDVSGEWTAEGSPYIATGDVVLRNGETLDIDAGVEVLFRDNTAFYIHGQLTSNGSEEDSIYYMPEDEHQIWRGLRFINADRRSCLSYCVVAYGRAISNHAVNDTINSGGNIFIWNSDITIEHSRISYGQVTGHGAGIGIWRSDPIIRNCLVDQNLSNAQAGAVYLHQSSPDILNCRFIENQTAWGGGGLCLEQNSNPLIENCAFTGNLAATGGGIADYGGSPTIRQCTFCENSANTMGGGAYLRDDGSDPLVEWCTFYRNTADVGTGWGGGLLLRFNTGSEVRYCRFIENEALYGGGIYVQQNAGQRPQCSIHHDLFCDNLARVAGGAIAVSENMGNSALDVENCTFIYNSAQAQDEPNTAFSPRGSRIHFNSSIILGELPHFWDHNLITVEYSHISEGYNGRNNSPDDPQLFMKDSTWCLLWGSSPCVNSGDPNLPDDPDRSRNDRGWLHFPHDALGGLETDTLSADLEAGTRYQTTIHFQNDTGVPIYASPINNWREPDREITVDVTEITEDSEIHGVARTADGYLLSGGNSGDDPNQIYCLDNDFNLVEQLDQPGGIDGVGFFDLAYVGNGVFYGGDEEQICEFNADGELLDAYGSPMGLGFARALGVDVFHADQFIDVYIGGDEGNIVRTNDEMQERERFNVGSPVRAIGIKENSRAVYIATESAGGIGLLSILFPEDSSVVPLYPLDLPDGRRMGGFEVTQNWEAGKGTLIGIKEGDGDVADQLFVEHFYVSWLVVRPEWEFLMPGDEAEWEIEFTSNGMANGEYRDVIFLAVNGYGEGNEIQTILRVTGSPVDPRANDNTIPTTLQLNAVYPNPFNSSAIVRYSLPFATRATLTVYDPLGRRIATLFEGYRKAGVYTANLTAADLPSGLCFVRLKAGNEATIQKTIIIK